MICRPTWCGNSHIAYGITETWGGEGGGGWSPARSFFLTLAMITHSIWSSSSTKILQSIQLVLLLTLSFWSSLLTSISSASLISWVVLFDSHHGNRLKNITINNLFTGEMIHTPLKINIKHSLTLKLEVESHIISNYVKNNITSGESSVVGS